MASEIVLKGIRGLLRPLVKMCLTHSIPLQSVTHLLKEIFIEIAREELEGEGESASNSRISMMTGINRKDVARLNSDYRIEPSARPIAQRVLHHWQHLVEKGDAAELGCSGAGSPFYQMVHELSADINPYTVLFELQRIGAVERRGGSVALCAGVYKPVGDLEEGYRLLARDTEILFAAVEDNLWRSEAEENLHLSTEYDKVSAEAIPEIKTWLLAEGSSFHRRARDFISQFDLDVNPELTASRRATHQSAPTARVFVGAFSYVETNIDSQTTRFSF